MLVLRWSYYHIIVMWYFVLRNIDNYAVALDKPMEVEYLTFNFLIPQLCWKKLPKGKGDNYLALTGPFPELLSWSTVVPEPLRGSVKEWRPYERLLWYTTRFSIWWICRLIINNGPIEDGLIIVVAIMNSSYVLEENISWISTSCWVFWVEI